MEIQINLSEEQIKMMEELLNQANNAPIDTSANQNTQNDQPVVE